MEKDKQDRFFERFQTSLREHLLTFNDGVIAIIITIMVLSIPAPRSDGDFWYDAHRIFITFKRATKQVVIADFFLLTLSFIPVMTKWIIIDPSQMALAVYGGVYLLVQMCAFWIFVAGNYGRVHKGAVWQTALVRTLLTGIPLAVVLILLPKITLIMYLVLPIIRSSHLIEHLDDIIIKSKTPDFLSGVLCRV
ncbi:TMEM175 family protein [Lactobacillus amylovorus]|uniref:TMEM175 family protein n=2 Tax=Lactobacillus amylovorus TaxID=1604 RepID=UPI0021A50C53|nr:TMEM175 family protein [Lactobacillus amylovorus]MDB6230232.1 hypothetical protein [Lactobacillus amylovorus]MDY5445018.1 hypothetical protein [Lactobacillus amylovorus]